MFAIGKIDLTKQAQTVVSDRDVKITSEGITTSSSRPGRVLLLPVNITMAVEWAGFDVIGNGEFEVSIRRPSIDVLAPPRFYFFDSILGTWISSPIAKFYSEADFRIYFKAWTGAFQLELKITKAGR